MGFNAGAERRHLTVVSQKSRVGLDSGKLHIYVCGFQHGLRIVTLKAIYLSYLQQSTLYLQSLLAIPFPSTSFNPS